MTTLHEPLKSRRRPFGRFATQPRQSVLGLALDGNRLEGFVVQRTNGSVLIRKALEISLSLDPLKDDPSLAGREIRKHLEAAGIRERRCVVSLPLNWFLTLTTPLPKLPENDQASYLEIEAERGFPYTPGTLLLDHSRYAIAPDESSATLVAVPRDHITRLGATLNAAQLRPVSFSLGITALQPAATGSSPAVLALIPCKTSIGLLISCGGGIAVLRSLEDAFDPEGPEHSLQADHLYRELRITLGQLPPDVRSSVRLARVFGRNDTADELAEELAPRLKELEVTVEQVREYGPDDFNVRLPAHTPVSPALSLALRYLTGQRPELEFLPPRIGPWQQLQARYPAGKLAWAGAIVGVVALFLLGALLFQQWQLFRWQARWTAMQSQVTQLEAKQREVQLYRPWLDDSLRCLNILRRLTEAFPEQGSVTARTIEIRPPSAVVCTGTALNNQALLQTLDQLRNTAEISSVQVEQIRGKAPAQFTFNFQWTDGGSL